MSGEQDIPGFYRDPKTGKYFKEEPGDRSNPSLNKLKAKRVEYESNKFVPNVMNTIQHLKNRELGLVSGINAEKEYFQIRTYGKRQVHNVQLKPVVNHDMVSIVSVDFLKGDDKAMFGMWITKDSDRNFHRVVGEESFLNTPNTHLNAAYRLCNNIIDMCRGPQETLLAVYNIPNVYNAKVVGCFEFIHRESIFDYYRPHNFIQNRPLYCCSSVKKGTTCALGGNGFIRLYRGLETYYFVAIKGRVYTLSSYEPREILMSGTHLGTIFLHDPKTKIPVLNMKISNKAVNDSLFINENQAILSDVDGKLVKVDLRMKDIVAYYYGHKHSVTKRPFSVANNMLCASGVDNVIRLWHLSGGHPIHEVRPVVEAENKIRGWLNADGNKTYLNYFEGAYKKVFEL